MKTRNLLVAGVMVLAVAGLSSSHLLSSGAAQTTTGGKAAAPPHDVVSTATATLVPWQERVHAVGQLQAVYGIDVASEVSGIVDAIDFASGSDVVKGDLLLHLRLNDEPGHLEQLEAAADLAEISLRRDRRQLQAQTASQATIDSDEATLRSDKAQIAALRAMIAEKEIRAPFSGRIGIRVASLGQYLSPGMAIANLQQLDPIYVNVSVPQPQSLQIRRGQKMPVHIDAVPNEKLVATVTAIAPAIDLNTRMVQVQATLANSQHRLLPGMFVTADIEIGSDRRVIAVPTAALTYSPYGSEVFVVDKQSQKPQYVVHERTVGSGETRGDLASIGSGLQAGDLVVTAGQLKLHDGDIVDLDDTVQPGSQSEPHPPEE